jgi:hypothetical protein
VLVASGRDNLRCVEAFESAEWGVCCCVCFDGGGKSKEMDLRAVAGRSVLVGIAEEETGGESLHKLSLTVEIEELTRVVSSEI